MEIALGKRTRTTRTRTAGTRTRMHGHAQAHGHARWDRRYGCVRTEYGLARIDSPSSSTRPDGTALLARLLHPPALIELPSSLAFVIHLP